MEDYLLHVAVSNDIDLNVRNHKYTHFVLIIFELNHSQFRKWVKCSVHKITCSEEFSEFTQDEQNR